MLITPRALPREFRDDVVAIAKRRQVSFAQIAAEALENLEQKKIVDRMTVDLAIVAPVDSRPATLSRRDHGPLRKRQSVPLQALSL